MPFTIGEYVSPGMLQLLGRKQEDDRQAGFEAQRINLAARAQEANEDADANQLEIALSRLRGDDADRALRAVLAEREAAMDQQRLGIAQEELALRGQGQQQDYELAQGRFGLEQEEFDANKGFRERALAVDEAGADVAAQRLGIDRGELELRGKTADREYGLKLAGHQQDTKFNEARIRNLDTDNEIAREELGARTAIRKREAVIKELAAVVGAYKAAQGDGLSEPDTATATQTAERIRTLMEQLDASDQAAVMQQLPPEVAADVAGSPFAAKSVSDYTKRAAAGLVR